MLALCWIAVRGGAQGAPLPAQTERMGLDADLTPLEAPYREGGEQRRSA